MPTHRGFRLPSDTKSLVATKKQGENTSLLTLRPLRGHGASLWFSCVIQSAEWYYLRKYEVRSRVATMDLLPVFLT